MFYGGSHLQTAGSHQRNEWRYFKRLGGSPSSE